MAANRAAKTVETHPWSRLSEELGHTANENARACRGPRIRTAVEVYEILRPDLEQADQEHFIAILVDGKHRPIRRVLIGLGTVASVDVHPREAFREAIRSSACALFFAHNHPSGDPEPSPDDLSLTARLRDVGRLVGIPVLDHVIIAREGYVSLAERGLL